MIVAKVANVNIDLNNYMFGSVLALDNQDVVLSVVCSVAVMVLYVVFYNKIFAVTFDENFSRATGTRAGVYNMLIALLTAVIIVVGMRLMGALLISSLIIFPSLISMRVCKSFRSVTICSVIVSVACFLMGLGITFFVSIPTGACIVAVNLAVFLVFYVIELIRRRNS